MNKFFLPRVITSIHSLWVMKQSNKLIVIVFLQSKHYVSVAISWRKWSLLNSIKKQLRPYLHSIFHRSWLFEMPKIRSHTTSPTWQNETSEMFMLSLLSSTPPSHTKFSKYFTFKIEVKLRIHLNILGKHQFFFLFSFFCWEIGKHQF